MAKLAITHQADPVLVWGFVILIFLGLLMLFSASLPLSYEKTENKKDGESSSGNPTYYLLHQILYGLLPGIFFAYFFSKFSLDFLKQISPLIFIL